VKLNVLSPMSNILGGARLSHLAELPFLDYNTADIPRSTTFLKRTLDICVSSVALVLLAPLFALIAIAIRIDSPGAALFRQRRAGKDGNPFEVLKFRTMVADAEERLPDVVELDELCEPVYKPRDDPRVTRIGRLLRRMSIDELPQLINVLEGEMSLVGPRPEMLHMVDRYELEHRFRLAVRPGLTGPMQVFGRGELTFAERLAVERDYIENQSIGRDMRILAMTVSTVLRGTGAF
jgi:lipopolysaccharide/colanic/teichoic acid biosynthesis glycosyltransferase